MAINLASSFGMNAALPLDDRTVVADTTARDAILAGRRYEGLAVYVEADGKVYRLVGGITNSDWVLDGGIDPTSNYVYIYGDSGTDGSIRINTSAGDFTVEKRVAGVWTFMGSFSV